MARRQDDGPALPLYLTEPGARWPTTASTSPLAPGGQPARAATGSPSSSCRACSPTTSPPARCAVLRRLGYDVPGWGLGRNIGPTAACVTGMRDLLNHLADKHGRPVIADRLEPGRHLRPRPGPPLPRLGPPGHHPGQPVPHRAAQPEPGDEGVRAVLAPARRAPHAPAGDRGRAADDARDVDLLALRRDRALADLSGHPGERCENIAVMASHLGLGHHPAAIWAIADRLAQPEARGSRSRRRWHPPPHARLDGCGLVAMAHRDGRGRHLGADLQLESGFDGCGCAPSGSTCGCRQRSSLRSRPR